MVRAIGPDGAVCTRTTANDRHTEAVALPLDKCQEMMDRAEAYEPPFYNQSEPESGRAAIHGRLREKSAAELQTREKLYQGLSTGERHYIASRWFSGYESHEYDKAFKRRRQMPSYIGIGPTVVTISLSIAYLAQSRKCRSPW